MKCWEAAVEILTETDNPAVMWGDLGLCCLIAARWGRDCDMRITEARVLQALQRCPGPLISTYTMTGRNRRVRKFVLPTAESRKEM